jgi:hypothetical protein
VQVTIPFEIEPPIKKLGAVLNELYQIPLIKTCAPTDVIQWT